METDPCLVASTEICWSLFKHKRRMFSELEGKIWKLLEL